MIKVGVLLNFPVSYKGGINYLKNLFFAISEFYSDKVTILLFVPEGLDKEYLDIFSPYCSIVETSILKRKSFSWLVSRVGEKFLGFDILCYLLLKKYKIDIVSHSNYVFPTKEIKSINWIPDFQYLHYPHLWTSKQLKSEHKWHRYWIKKSDLIVLSSHDASKDFSSIYEAYQNKVRILHFVSQSDGIKMLGKLPDKYTSDPYFYLPNQFWEHKNHMTAFEAVKLLKDKGIEVKLLTSGLMEDYRNKNGFIDGLKNFVTTHSLQDNVIFLGLIPYNDVLTLIHNAKAIINPSFFEGWSSTVEESKSLGKRVILSDISVHREQNPAKGYFFNPSDARQLAEIMERVWYMDNDKTDFDLLKNDLYERTRKFADTYYHLLVELIK